MIKLFERIFWHNNTTPAINEDNLNAMSKAIDDIDNRVIELAADVMETVPQIQAYLDQADDLVEAMELLTKNPPYIGANGNWYVWDTDTSSFVDSGIDASITVQIADVTMLNYGTAPYITNTGTNTDPIFHLFIPRAAGITSIAKTGTSGLVDTYTVTFQDGNTATFTVTNGKGIVSIAKTSTSGQVDTYTITFNDSTTTTFTVTNGNGDMNKSVYDPNGAIQTAGGIKAYVDGEVSSVNSAFTNNVNVNGSKNLLPFIVATGTYAGINVVNDGKEITVSGTSTANPANICIFDVEGRSIDSGLSPACTIEELGIDLSKTYVFSRQEKVTGLRYAIRLYDSSSALATFELGNNQGLSLDIDFSQYPTCTRIKCTIICSYNVAIPSNTKFSAMLCLKSDYEQSTAWAPYAKPNRTLTEDSVTWDNLSEVGAVNRLENRASSSTVAGITVTVHNDKSITANGTNSSTTSNQTVISLTGNGSVNYRPLSDLGLKAGNSYRFSLGVQREAQNSWYFVIEAFNSSLTRVLRLDVRSGEYQDTIFNIPTDAVYIAVNLSVLAAKTINNVTFYPMITPVSYNGPYVPYAKTNKELTDELSTKIDIAGKPKQKIYRFAANSTTTTITVPLNKVSSYAQGSLHIRTSSKDSEAHITFALNQANTSVVNSAIKNYGTVDLSLDSMTISGQVLAIVIGGGNAYQWYSAEYFVSTSEGVTAEQPTWNFA